VASPIGNAPEIPAIAALSHNNRDPPFDSAAPICYTPLRAGNLANYDRQPTVDPGFVHPRTGANHTTMA
jgi:hypothetical protein